MSRTRCDEWNGRGMDVPRTGVLGLKDKMNLGENSGLDFIHWPARHIDVAERGRQYERDLTNIWRHSPSIRRAYIALQHLRKLV